MKLEIEIDDDTAADISRFLAIQDKESQSNTHGPLDMAGLARLAGQGAVGQRGKNSAQARRAARRSNP